jgi:hypothetical protein
MTYKQKGACFLTLIVMVAVFALASGILGDFGMLFTSFACFSLAAGSVLLMLAVSDAEVRHD